MKPKKKLKRLENSLIALMMITSLLSATTTSAASKTCDEVLQLCDKALQDERRETDSLKKLDHTRQIVIKAQEDHILVQREKIDLLKSENESPLRSPYLWFGLGLVTGVVLMKK